MATITPRFLERGPKTGAYRHVESVPVEIQGMIGTPATGAVCVRLEIEGKDGAQDRAVWVEFTPAELERMHAFAQDMLTGKPQEHAYSTRTYLVDGQHKAKVKGYYGKTGTGWHPATEPTCETCSLSYVQAQVIKFMAKHDVADMQVGGCKLVWVEAQIRHWLV